ncbi:unnamed protein product, partial [Hapterophycus canaliculatus]
RYISTIHPGYEEGKMSRIVSSSRCPKGRLLHYFPRSSAPLPESRCGGGGGGAFSDWCGWHHDHSCLTG